MNLYGAEFELREVPTHISPIPPSQKLKKNLTSSDYRGNNMLQKFKLQKKYLRIRIIKVIMLATVEIINTGSNYGSKIVFHPKR